MIASRVEFYKPAAIIQSIFSLFIHMDGVYVGAVKCFFTRPLKLLNALDQVEF
jgi:hypothetical protein